MPAIALGDAGILLAALSVSLGAESLRAGLAWPVVWQHVSLVLCCVLSFYYHDLYDLSVVRGVREFAPRLLRSLGVALALWLLAWAAWPEAFGNTVAPLVLLPLVAGLVLPLRAATYTLVRREPFVRRVLLLGSGPLAQQIVQEIANQPSRGFEIAGLVLDPTAGAPNVPQRPASPHPTFSGVEGFEETVGQVRPDLVVVALAERRGQLPVATLLKARVEGIEVEDGIEFYESLTQKLAVESLVPSALIFCKALRRHRLHLAAQRALSVVVSLLGLLLTLPLFPLIALLIKLDSKGPVFFVQARIGLGGQPFDLIKFRTMQVGSPDASNGVWHREEEHRITRVGAWLRRLRFDEVPQFLNVLAGQMNLVGPRPEMASNVQTMTEQIPYYSLRHMLRPGVTGWAQVRFGYAVSQEEVLEKTCYDLYYIKNMSLALDLRILADTVRIVLFGRGAR